MTIQEEITNEQSAIAALRVRLKNIRLPPRTINWQHQNVGRINNGVQRRLETKRQKIKINNQIASSQNKIISLRDSIFGELGLWNETK